MYAEDVLGRREDNIKTCQRTAMWEYTLESNGLRFGCYEHQT